MQLTNVIHKSIKPGIFRLFLAVLVVFFHATRYFPFGKFAVSAFFILSGYWIFRMYDEYYSQQKNPFKKFMVSRILRILPLYYFCTILALILVGINSSFFNHRLVDFQNFDQIISMITLIPFNYLHETLLTPAWSLGIEMQFYLLVPIFIFLSRKMDNMLFFFLMLFISIIGSLSSIRLINLSVIPYLIYFSIGMLIWLKKPVISLQLFIWSVILAMLFVISHYVIPPLQLAIFERNVLIYGVNYMVLFSSILTFLSIPIISFSLQQDSDRKDRDLGDLSYTIYIFHWLPFCIYSYLFSESYALIRLTAFVGYLIITAVLSWLVYILFEKKVEVFRKKLLSKYN